MTEEDPQKRIDFLQIEKNKEFLAIKDFLQKNEKEIYEEERKASINEQNAEENLRLSCKFDRFVAKLEAEQKFTEKMEEELENLVNEISELEEENIFYKHSV